MRNNNKNNENNNENNENYNKCERNGFSEYERGTMKDFLYIFSQQKINSDNVIKVFLSEPNICIPTPILSSPLHLPMVLL